MKEWFLGDVLKAVENAQEYFSTLKGLFPVIDSCGRVCHSVDREAYRFRVRWQGNEYILSVIRSDDHSEQIEAECTRLQMLNNPYMASVRFYGNELSTAAQAARRADVVLQPIPSAENCYDVAMRNISCPDNNSLRGVMLALARVAEGLDNDSIVHSNITPFNIYILPDANLHLVNSRFVAKHGANEDSCSMLRLAVWLYLSTDSPSLRRIAWQTNLYRADGFDCFALRMSELKESHSNGILAQCLALYRILSSSRTDDRARVVALIESLAMAPHVDRQTCELLTEAYRHDMDDIEPTDEYHNGERSDIEPYFNVAPTHCDAMGHLCDTLIRFRSAGRWGYVDKAGHCIIPNIYLDACDFYESRAAVRSASGWGLIDRQGGTIMECQWEDLTWEGETNTVLAMKDGRWYLFDRMGRLLTAEGFDWLDGSSEGLRVARRGKRYGYVDTLGRPLSIFGYSEASPFRGGEAIVERSGRTIRIDRNFHPLGDDDRS